MVIKRDKNISTILYFFINLIFHFVCLDTRNINCNIHLFLFRKKNETTVILYKKRIALLPLL